MKDIKKIIGLLNMNLEFKFVQKMIFLTNFRKVMQNKYQKKVL